jgi:branched-chain amino acid transport system ATP-binding protein
MLELENVTTTYGGIVAVRGVTLSVPAGSTVALIGSNGAGKTTLLHSICGVCRPSGGTITLRGENITGAPAHRIARKGVLLVPEGRQAGWRSAAARPARIPV